MAVPDAPSPSGSERTLTRVVVAGSCAAFVAVLTCSQGSDAAPAAIAPATTTPPAAPAPAPEAEDPEPAIAHYDVNHVLGTGQSLSVGANGFPALTRAQPYDNLMFAPGPMPGGEFLTRFVPLGERGLETMSSAFANLVSKMARDEGRDGGSHALLVSAHGKSSTGYWGLRRGTKAYATGLAQVRAAREIARTHGQSYVVRAITNVHGESDHVEHNAHYERDLIAWQADYERDVRAITAQAEPIPMFETQMSSWTRYGQATSAIPIAQLDAHVHASGKVVLVGPKYHLRYFEDGIHLTNEGYRHMGEDYAKAYRRVVLEGRAWEPVRPRAVTRTGATITIAFYVPSPPLVLDTTTVSDPGSYGFEYVDDSRATPRIASVAVTGPDTVTIDLAAEPTGGHRRVRYAFTGAPGAHAGPTTGPRGNLRDSDATASLSGDALYDWCVHFDEPVP